MRKSVDNTLALLRQELEIRKGEILESLHFASLEKIFIEERIYKDKEFEQAKNMDAACEHIDERLTPYYPTFIREVTKEDILRLMEIKMARILKFNSDKAEELIARMRKGHRGDRPPSGKHRGIYRRLVPYVEGQVRQSLPPAARNCVTSTPSKQPKSSKPTKSCTSTAKRVSSELD